MIARTRILLLLNSLVIGWIAPAAAQDDGQTDPSLANQLIAAAQEIIDALR